MTHDEFLRALAAEYPAASQEAEADGGLGLLVIPTLIAPDAIRLPHRILQDARELVSLFFNKIRLHRAEGDRLRSLEPAISDPGNASVLMSYDFHLSSSGDLRLIEINTNASMAAMVDIMNAVRGLERAKKLLADDFEAELGRPLKGAHIAIVDDSPKTQKLYAEFLLFKEMLSKRGADVSICDRRDLRFQDGKLWGPAAKKVNGPIDLVYNRTTDFYFGETESAALAQCMREKAAVITPHPHEYRLLADKNRLVDWSRPGHLESLGLSEEEISKLRQALIPTREVQSVSPDELWTDRKKLIFKPKNLFGGKSVFRGGGISRGVFQRLLTEGGLVQEFVPAPTVMISGVEYKYDLRFFAYRDQIRLSAGRLYQGQMTNATTVGGGVTSIIWD